MEVFVMKTRVLALLTVLATVATAQSQWPSNVTVVASEKGKVVTVEGKLESGTPIADLSWAANSSEACFPGTQFEKFRGNHVLFATSLPTRSIMKITVAPKDTSKDLSLYAYSVGATDFKTLPPNIPRVVSCEAEHKWDRPKAGKTQDHTRWVELNAIQNPYNVVIGVSGPKEAVSGEFTLSIELK
jgi:hypothetical protein